MNWDRQEDSNANACKVASLMLMQAAMLQARIEASDSGARKLLRDCHLVDAENPANEPSEILRRAWESILEYDYLPVFKPALNILTTLDRADAEAGVGRALRVIARCATENAETYATMRADHAGELFSRVLGNQASDGAFFTRPPAARLLAELALDATGETDWANPATWRRLKAADLACGSGTLLHAFLVAVKDRIKASGADAKVVKAFHKYAVEQMLVGFDINPISIQLAACRLTLGQLDADYRQMQLYELPYGPWGGDEVRIGTLDLLLSEEILGTHDASPLLDFENKESLTGAVAPDIADKAKDCRVVIMNPPFSANNQRAAKFPPEVRKAMQSRELAVRDALSAADADAGAVFDANSISTLFTPLADKVLRADDGVLAKVLPVTACTGASGQREREFLADRFHIDLIVCCHDPGQPSNSFHASVNDCLLIASRKQDDSPTKFVSLRGFPSMDDAPVWAAAIREGRYDTLGNVCEWPYERMREGDWSPVQWFDPELAKVARSLREKIGSRPLGEIYEMGPTGRAIQDAFERASKDDPDAIPIFDSISKELRFSLASEPDKYWRVKPDERKRRTVSSDLVEGYLKQRGHVVIAKSADTTNAMVAAVCRPEKHFGTGFIPVQTTTLEQAKALCVLWNSTCVHLQRGPQALFHTLLIPQVVCRSVHRSHQQVEIALGMSA